MISSFCLTLNERRFDFRVRMSAIWISSIFFSNVLSLKGSKIERNAVCMELKLNGSKIELELKSNGICLKKCRDVKFGSKIERNKIELPLYHNQHWRLSTVKFYWNWRRKGNCSVKIISIGCEKRHIFYKRTAAFLECP